LNRNKWKTTFVQAVMPGALALPYVKLASTKAWCPLTSMAHWDVDTQTYRHPAVLARRPRQTRLDEFLPAQAARARQLELASAAEWCIREWRRQTTAAHNRRLAARKRRCQNTDDDHYYSTHAARPGAVRVPAVIDRIARRADTLAHIRWARSIRGGCMPANGTVGMHADLADTRPVATCPSDDTACAPPRSALATPDGGNVATARTRNSAGHRRSRRRCIGGYRPTHSLARQLELASEQHDRLQGMLEVRDSDFGDGLFAKETLPAGFSIHYYGQFYSNSTAVEDAELGNGQYVIAKNKRSHHVDGLAIPVQYATRANHRPHRLANATLIWDDDYGEYGQPKVEMNVNVSAGQEITVDYGRHFDYAGNNFRRGDGREPRSGTDSATGNDSGTSRASHRASRSDRVYITVAELKQRVGIRMAAWLGWTECVHQYALLRNMLHRWRKWMPVTERETARLQAAAAVWLKRGDTPPGQERNQMTWRQAEADHAAAMADFDRAGAEIGGACASENNDNGSSDSDSGDNARILPSECDTATGRHNGELDVPSHMRTNYRRYIAMQISDLKKLLKRRGLLDDYDSLAARHGAATVLARADSTSAAVTTTTMASLVPAVREGDHGESVQHAPSTSEAAQAALAGSGCNRSATVEGASIVDSASHIGEEPRGEMGYRPLGNCNEYLYSAVWYSDDEDDATAMHERDAEWALWDDHNLATVADKWSWAS
jgi:hypothetical protein